MTSLPFANRVTRAAGPRLVTPDVTPIGPRARHERGARRRTLFARTVMAVAVAAVAAWEPELRAQSSAASAPASAPAPASAQPQRQAPGQAAPSSTAAAGKDAAPHQPAPAVEHAAPSSQAAPAAQGQGHGAPPAPAASGDAHAQPAAPAAHGSQPAADGGHAQPAHGAAAAHAAEEHHGESPLAFAARIANFFILAGGLYYFLRKPVSEYLAGRDQQIRSDLITAKETTATATAQLAEIDRKLQALPAELVALKARGAEEIASEEFRIRQAADTERQRLIEQTRREIDLQVRLAKRALTEQAATLAVDLATTQIQQTMTPEDQTRLVDRYVTQVRKAPVD